MSGLQFLHLSHKNENGTVLIGEREGTSGIEQTVVHGRVPYVPGTVLGAEGTEGKKIDRNPFPHGDYLLGRDRQ